MPSRNANIIKAIAIATMRTRPELQGVIASAFELSHLPNRAELRLKDLNRVIGYTLSQVKNDSGEAIGAVMFFKDLTRVEQLEERERLRDRLATLGEMAAAIAHEVKNPLASIEVMAGVLRRQLPDRPEALETLVDGRCGEARAEARRLDEFAGLGDRKPPRADRGQDAGRGTRR